MSVHRCHEKSKGSTSLTSPLPFVGDDASFKRRSAELWVVLEDLSVGLHPIKSLGTPQEFLAPSKMAGRSHASPLDSPASDRASRTVRLSLYFLGFTENHGF